MSYILIGAFSIGTASSLIMKALQSAVCAIFVLYKTDKTCMTFPNWGKLTTTKWKG